MSIQRVDLERALLRYQYTSGPRDEQVEAMTFPGMAETFTRMTDARSGLPPTQHDYTVAVLYTLGLRRTPAIVGRIGRGWISFVVQWHAYVTLNELLPLAIWDVRADTVFGVDLIAFDAADPDAWVPVALALRVPGVAGEQYAARKNGRHRPHGLVVRELICDPREHPVGPFWLISPERLAQTVRSGAEEARTWAHRMGEDEDVFWAGYHQAERDALRAAP